MRREASRRAQYGATATAVREAAELVPSVIDDGLPAIAGAPSAEVHAAGHRSNPASGSADVRPLPAGSIVLHIGPPKTGTTALQAGFDVARRAAEAQGVHYAGQGRHSMSAVLAGIGRPSPWRNDRRPPGRAAWNRLLREIRSSKASRVVLSSEFFADADDAAIRRIVDDLGGGRLQVVATVRPLAAILPSQWQQFVQNRLTMPFDQWLEAILADPPAPVTPSFWKRHRVDRLLARWAHVIGPERMTLVILGDGDRTVVLRAFESLTGLVEGTLPMVDDSANRSMTQPETELIRAFNLAYEEAGLPAALYTRVMRFGAASLMKQREPLRDEPRLQLPAWAEPRVAEIGREIAAGVVASGARLVGRLEDLAELPAVRGSAGPARARRGTTAPVAASKVTASVPVDVAVTAAMGVLVASGLARGTANPEAGGAQASRSRVTARVVGMDDTPPLLLAPRPVQEPPELFRVSSIQMLVVLLRRAKASTLDIVARRRPWLRP
jgi:hypothetical protein